jgi:hypothetical protein
VGSAIVGNRTLAISGGFWQFPGALCTPGLLKIPGGFGSAGGFGNPGGAQRQFASALRMLLAAD